MTLFGRSTLKTWDKTWDLGLVDMGWDDDMQNYFNQKGPGPKKDPFCADMDDHLNCNLWDRGHLDSHMYSSYPEYEDRLRVLKAYMDSKKPKGFRGLWRDKRDTYSYYTFWGVIIFGSVSVLLALLSLIASVLQTIATWKALDLPLQNSHS